MTEYEFHPVCLAFPRMSDDAFAKRRADYAAYPERANQSVVELTADDDDGGTMKICDGRHHYLICQELGYEFGTMNFFPADRDDLVRYVEARNNNRRHMTASQIAACIVALNTFQQGGDRGNQHTGGKASRDALPTRQKSADDAGISVKTLERAAKVAKEAPDVLPSVRDGKLDAHTAAKVAELPKSDRKKIVEAADPKAAAKAKLAVKKPKAAERVIVEPAAEATAERPSTAGEVEADEEPAEVADPAAEYVSRLNKLCVAIDRIKADVLALSDSPFGRLAHTESVTAQLVAARQSLWLSRPTELCPVATEHADGVNCRVCLGTGYTSEAAAKRAAKSKGRGL